MDRTLQQLGTSFLRRVATDTLLTISEGFIKVRCAQAALDLGWELQEGAGNAPSGPVADFARASAGQIQWTRGPRRAQLPQGSADLCVVSPFTLFLEIKARPDFGTKSQAQFQEMDADVSRCAQHTNVALFFIFDSKIYLSFSGEKTETRGRPAVAAEWFNRYFPKLTQIPVGLWLSLEAVRDGEALSLHFQKTEHSPSHILVLGGRRDTVLQPHAA